MVEIWWVLFLKIEICLILVFFFPQKTPLYMLLRYIFFKFLKMEKKLTTQKNTLSQPKGEFLVEI
jgi:hypothetical protein